MTPAESGVVLDALLAAFPRVVMSAETVQLYARFLVDIALEAAVAAVAKWIARSKTFPTIAELREACSDIVGDGPPDADRAFVEVMRKVGSVGMYGSPRWSHPAIRDAVDAITWREICLSEHPPSLRAHFAKAYEAAKRRTADPGHAQLVAGIVTELKQKLLGAPSPQPALKAKT